MSGFFSGTLFLDPLEQGTIGGHSLEFYRAMSAIIPGAIVLVFVVISLTCADCCGKQGKKPKRKESPGSAARRAFIMSEMENSLEPLLHTPTGSVHEGSYDCYKMSFGYNNNSMIKSPTVRPDIEGTYKALTDSPVQTTTPPFDRLMPTLHGKLRKEENRSGASRSPSPTTLIRQGKEMRYGAWLHTSSTSSGTSDTSQTIFPMSMPPYECNWLNEREMKAKEEKRLLREKKRRRRDRMEEQAQIIRDQINWSVRDEEAQQKREARAIKIPPRKRMEEHPVYQRVVRAMFEEKQAGYDATILLNSAWERGRLEDYVRENMGYVPDRMVAGEGFPTLRPELVHIEPEGDSDERKPLLGAQQQSQGARRKVRFANEVVQHVYKPKRQRRRVHPESEAARSHRKGSRRKVRLETGAAGSKTLESESVEHQSQHKEARIRSETEAAQDQSRIKGAKSVHSEAETKAAVALSEVYLEHHGARRKVPGTKKAVADNSQPQHRSVKALPETEEKGKTDQYLLRYHADVKKEVLDTSRTPGAGEDAGAETEQKRKVASAQPLFSHYGGGRNYGTMTTDLRPMGVFTTAMMDTRVPLVVGKEFEERGLEETKKVSSKIARAVFDVEMKRIREQVMESRLKTTVGKKVETSVEIHPEPLSSGLVTRRIDEMLTDSRLKPQKVETTVEIHPEPSSTGLVRRIEEEMTDSLLKPTIEKKVETSVEIHPEPSSTGLVTRRIEEMLTDSRLKPEKVETTVEIHPEPSSSGLVRRKLSPMVHEHTVIDLGEDDS